MYPHFSCPQLKSIKKACRLTSQTFEEIRKLIKPGQTEKEIAYKLRKMLLSRGAQSLAFRPIVASGPGTSEPHHKNTLRKINKNDIVLLDFGCKFNNYCSDLSRTIFIGSPRPEWLKVYNIVKKAQQKSFIHLSIYPYIHFSIKASALDAIARDYIAKKGYGRNFIHGLGHGLGTRVHQYFRINPKSKAIIKPGMVFTIEPGIYLKGKFGVRTEDVVSFLGSKIEVLTR